MKTILKLIAAVGFFIVCLGEASTLWAADFDSQNQQCITCEIKALPH
jgi:hypothetical protein